MFVTFASLLTHLPPGNFANECILKLVKWFSGQCQELKLVRRPFTGRKLRGRLIQMQNISLLSLGMHRKQNFEIVVGFKTKKWHSSLDFYTFGFLSSPLLSVFLPHFFCLLLGFISRRILKSKCSFYMSSDFQPDPSE